MLVCACLAWMSAFAASARVGAVSARQPDVQSQVAPPTPDSKPQRAKKPGKDADSADGAKTPLAPEEIAARVDPERPSRAAPSTLEESRVSDAAPLTEFEGKSVKAIESRYDDRSLARRSYVIVANGKATAVDHGPDWRWYENHQIKLKRTWRAGKQSGPFQEWHETGYPKTRGQYADDEPDGAWTAWYEDGSAHSEHHYVKGQLDGRQRDWFESGIRWHDEEYKLGKQEGVERSWYGNGARHTEVHWRAGRRHGPSTEWTREGAVQESGVYEDGAETGEWVRVDPDGNKIEEHYKAGLLDGRRTVWSPAGKKISEGDHALGKAVGVHTNYFPSGSKSFEIEYKDGVQQGSARFYYESGAVQSEGRMENGKKEGVWTFWNLDGTRDAKQSGRYHADQKVADE